MPCLLFRLIHAVDVFIYVDQFIRNLVINYTAITFNFLQFQKYVYKYKEIYITNYNLQYWVFGQSDCGLWPSIRASNLDLN